MPAEKDKQDIAGPHVSAGQARFGQDVKQGGDGLRSPAEATVDDLSTKHPGNLREPHHEASRGVDVRAAIEGGTSAPEGLQRAPTDPLNKSSGRRPPQSDK